MPDFSPEHPDDDEVENDEEKGENLSWGQDEHSPKDRWDYCKHQPLSGNNSKIEKIIFDDAKSNNEKKKQIA